MNKEFWKATGIRALRTICQTAVASIGTAIAITEVDWRYVVSASLLAGLLSVLTSIATGLPEVDGYDRFDDGDDDDDEEDDDESFENDDEYQVF